MKRLLFLFGILFVAGSAVGQNQTLLQMQGRKPGEIPFHMHMYGVDSTLTPSAARNLGVRMDSLAQRLGIYVGATESANDHGSAGTRIDSVFAGDMDVATNLNVGGTITTAGMTATGNVVVSGAQSYGVPQASYSASSGNWAPDLNSGNTMPVNLNADLVFLAPTNIKAGATYTWIFTQDGTPSTPQTVARGTAAAAIFPDSIIVSPNTNDATYYSCYSDNGATFQRCWNDSYYVDTKQWHAGAFSTDGVEATGCGTPREVTINSGPKRFIVNCEDNAASLLYFDIVMPDGWDTRGITLELAAMDTTTATTVLDIDFSAQCRGDGDVVNNTWGTAQNASITFGGTAYTLEHATTAAITPNGTCVAGDHVFIKGDVDDAGGNTNGTNWILAIKAEFGLVSGG